MSATMTRDLTYLEHRILGYVQANPGCTRGRAGIHGDNWLSSRGRAYRYRVVSRLEQWGLIVDRSAPGARDARLYATV